MAKPFLDERVGSDCIFFWSGSDDSRAMITFRKESFSASKIGVLRSYFALINHKIGFIINPPRRRLIINLWTSRPPLKWFK